jgi:hypothetical protein
VQSRLDLLTHYPSPPWYTSSTPVQESSGKFAGVRSPIYLPICRNFRTLANSCEDKDPPSHGRGRWFEPGISTLNSRLSALQSGTQLLGLLRSFWARSSVGRALPSHGRGHEFESRRVHSQNVSICRYNTSNRNGLGEISPPFDTNLTPTQLQQESAKLVGTCMFRVSRA